MITNNDGFVVKGGGDIQVFSNRSALSGLKLPNGSPMIPLPEHPGVFFRVTPAEFMQLTPEQAQVIAKKADELRLSLIKRNKKADINPPLAT